MPKKKKKGRASTGGGDDWPSCPPQDKFVAIENHCVDLLSLQIIPSTTPPIKTLQYTPMILMTADDADRLDLQVGDFALVLAQEQASHKIFATTVARVHISNSSTVSTPKSPQSSRDISKTQRSKLSPGYCHVFPSTLAQQLQQASTKDQIGQSQAETTTPKNHPTEVATSAKSNSLSISSPSPSKSKFSFARGGGGDALITSPAATPASKLRTTPPNPQMESNKPSSTPRLWVVPLESDLADELSKLLKLPPARRLHLDFADTPPTKNLSDHNSQSVTRKLLQGSLGQALIRAHLLSSYVSTGILVMISVQGQAVPCQVKGMEPTSSTESLSLSGLESKMATLSMAENDPTSTALDNTEGPEFLVSCVKKSLVAMKEDETSNNRIRVFQITRATTIVFGEDKETSSPSSSTDSESPPLKPLLAGLDETIERVQSLLLTPLLHPELFQSSSGSSSLRPPKGVLVYGASGSGKSTLAKQVAQSLQSQHKVSIQEISCAKLQSQTSLVGQAEQELVRHFQAATRRITFDPTTTSASLIVLDDVHLICPRRQGLNVAADRLAATLLALLDGLDSTTTSNTSADKNTPYHPIMVLAVTNNPALLDAALRRPGRLDAEVEVPLPDEPSTRSTILQFQLAKYGAKIDLEDEVWLSLARMAKGFTGADLELAAKEAIRTAFLRCRTNDTEATGVIILDKHDLETSIRSIKPSAIKAVSVEIPQVHWTSIGGMEEVKRQLREAIELPLTHSAMFAKLGIRPPRGVLLYGPPGCSKTLMARALATEGQMNFLAVKGPELLSKWLGESERALASLFRRARLASPSVIFFDEVDAIATKRGGGNSGGGERLLSQLLTELDGIQSGNGKEKQRVVVVCATNRPDLLDGALMRPGRIDRMIYVGVPDQESRLRILELGLKNKACEDDLDIPFLSQEDISGGLSGAELVSACRDAALFALEESENFESNTAASKPTVAMRHVLHALKEIERQITPEMINFYLQFQGKKGFTS